jgi:soluble lytic murein transglycosylase-like protein
MTRYFQDAHFSEVDRPLFAFASYNAGPGNIAKLSRLIDRRLSERCRMWLSAHLHLG